MDKMRRGRPKSKEPIRNKNISIRMSEKEVEQLRKVCIENDIRYIDVILEGLKHWTEKEK